MIPLTPLTPSSPYYKEMKLLNRIVLIALVALLCNESFAQVPDKPAQASPVVDMASIINNDSLVAALNAQLDTLSKKTQNQIVIVTVNDLGGIDAKEFATELGRKWGVGGKRLNNGLVMLIKPRNDNGDGEIGFAVGYGLEGAIPDVFCKRLQTDYMVPHFKDGDYAGGIKAAIDEIVPVILDDYKHNQALASDSGKKKGGGNGWFILAVIVAVIAFIAFLRKRNKKAINTQQQPQTSNLKEEQNSSQEEKHDDVEETNAEDNNEDEEEDDDDDAKPATEEPEQYRYKYGGGDFGGGGAKTKF